MSNELALIPYSDLEKMASALGRGKMFGKTPEEMLPLMLLAQAENRHPAFVAQEFDIIQGRPAMNSKSALARFQAAGGRIEWLERTDKKASAKFYHAQGGELTVTWDWARATAAQLTGKDNWKKFPTQMLSARVVAEGVRAIFPGCLSGFYLAEEAQDFDAPKPEPRKAPTGPGAPKGPLFNAKEPKQAQATEAPRKVEPEAEAKPSHRQQVITFIGEHTDSFTPEQLAELRKALAHAGTTPAMLDEVESRAKEFIEINEASQDIPGESEPVDETTAKAEPETMSAGPAEKLTPGSFW